MPELPEVETIRRQLHHELRGGTIGNLEILHMGVVRNPAGLHPALLAGTPLRRFNRRGKILLVAAGEDILLAIHLKMTGQVTILPERAPGRHTRFILNGRRADGRPFWLHFNDARRFGRLFLLPSASAWLSAPLATIGPDALSVGQRQLAGLLARSRAPLKAWLLDQTRVAGIGNIYADEILHRSRLHPLTPADTLTPGRVARLHRSMRTVLRQAIKCGGSSVRDYRKTDGSPGAFQKKHLVYQRHGQPCRACAATVRRITVRGRGTHFCPACQPPPGNRRSGHG